MSKFLTILIIFTGEVFAIFAEVVAAKYYSFDNAKFFNIFLKALPIIIIGCILLLFGYMLGLRSFKNIWIVSAISITSILISEPIINYFVTHQLPTTGALIGFILGILGFFSAIFF
ncbi:MAG: hypothetical protein WC870_02490 [Candidatus Paceibacterota bacterium]